MIADDLTGACDAAVAFAQRGFRTAVLLEEGGGDLRDIEMNVVPTFSRDVPPEDARLKVEVACRWLEQAGIRLLYKKIDSTLKGNLAVEIEAVMACGGFQSAVVAPAFPAMGRVVIDGVLHVGGRPTLLRVPALIAGLPGVESPDARTDEDLREIAASAVAGGGHILCVGSGGLSAQLAALLAERFDRQPVAPLAPGKRGPALFVIGSEQPATRAQVDYLVRRRPATAVKLAEVEHGRVSEVFRQGNHLVVNAGPAEMVGPSARKLIASAVEHLASGLVVSGGDTAEWICRAAAVEAIDVKGEVLAGIPWGQALTASGQRWLLVTKAGGFGSQDALAVVADFLSGETNKRV